MNHFDIKQLLLAGITLAAIAIIGLWSWNTLAELCAAPKAQLRHAAAALALLAVFRGFLLPLRAHSLQCSRHTGSLGTPT